ncbi:DUF5821 family protein [Halorubrum sp. PV6]|uniref:transcriptional regulator TbsP domain-containing protein n=1 Tax=Halorubrum sp. PV6 TaxID=634157 RepID=UPI000F8599B9|nr:DUF5821 family protein [Halorubrum sp. PV6]AZQ14195.1 hypothetical protein DOS48_04750 [Halorubrum sp. PV6]
MTRVSLPRLPLVDGSLSIGSFTDPVLVDPTRPLLAAVVDAYRDAAPTAVDPSLDALRDAAGADGDPLSPGATHPTLPTLTVVAADAVVDALVGRYHPASRLAALVEAGTLELRSLDAAQPNPVLAGESDGCVLVAGGEDGNEASDAAGPWCRVGADATLRERYDALVSESEPVRLRTPSRHALYGALAGRCGSAVADEAIRLLDAGDDAEPFDRGAARRRVYAAGAREGAFDRDLRRACEDAGLGSAATFTRIKRALLDAGVVATESVTQPVGRPRHRLVARGALADATAAAEAVDALESI